MSRDREPPHGNGAPPPPPPPPPEHGRPKRKKRRLFRKIVTILILVLLILLVLYLWKGPGFGTGSGGTASQPPENNTTSPSATETEPAADQDGGAKVIIVRIDGEIVSVDGTVVADAEALKQAVLDLSTDDTVFRLEDHDSILATYDWVTQAFQEMSIPLDEAS